MRFYKGELTMKQKMVGGVPGNVLGMLSDLSHKLQHGKLTPRELELFLKRRNPFGNAVGDILAEWQAFWQKLGVDADLSVVVPDDAGGFEQVIVVPQGLTLNRVVKSCRGRFPVQQYIDDLDRDVTENERTPANSSYAIRIRNRVEADAEMGSKSADDIRKDGTTTLTLMERLIYELKFHEETGGHLDLVNWTLCAGSRNRNGHVPRVDWHSSKLCVYWDYADFRRGSLRARVAVL